MNYKKMNYPERLKELMTLAAPCMLCPRGCGVDRMRGEHGFCRASNIMGIAHIGLHHGEEPPLSGTRGSGTIFFEHCTLHCVFCQNYQISHPEQGSREQGAVGGYTDRSTSVSQVAEKMLWLQEQGAHNINLVTPTHYLPWIVDSIRIVRTQGLVLPIVYNSSGYESVETLRMLEGVIDIYLPDIKYSSNAMAKKYSATSDYVENNRAALFEMSRQVGSLEVDTNGIATRGMIVRHLVLPGNISGSLDCLNFLADMSKEMAISIMAQYSPQYHASTYPELNHPVSAKEYEHVVEHANKLGLENCWIQDLESKQVFVPDFNAADPFVSM